MAPFAKLPGAPQPPGARLRRGGWNSSRGIEIKPCSNPH